MNMYKGEIVKTLESEVEHLTDKVKFHRERADHNEIKMREYQSQLAEALDVLKQLKRVKY